MSFMLPTPNRDKLREIMAPAVKEWDATTREPVPAWALDLLRRLK